jgi:hypothetical protein
MSRPLSLWRIKDSKRWFLIPDDVSRCQGPISLQGLLGQSAQADEEWLAPFEVTEDQAYRAARDQLGQAVEELRSDVDQKVAKWRQKLRAMDGRRVSPGSTVVPNAASALVTLAMELPRVIRESLSGDERRVETARNVMLDLHRQLEEAGIALDERFTRFPDRLSLLREDTFVRSAETAGPHEESDPQDE